MPSRLVHVVVALDGRLDHAMERFCGPPGAWLPAGTTPRGDGHVFDLATGDLLPLPQIPVLAEVGTAIDTTHGVAMRTLSWRALRLAPAFPTLHADVELDLRTQGGRRPCLRLVGAYTPPLAVVGELADRYVLRHVVSEVARGFLAGVARALDAGSNGRGRPDAEPRSG